MSRKSRLLAAVVADDLTGTLDGAAPFARRGLDVKVYTSVTDAVRIAGDQPQVIAVNTETRHLSNKIAAGIVRKLFSDLCTLQPKLLIKKIDSTVRGNVVAETVAAMQGSRRQKAIVCPALPAQGRTLIDGEIFIDNIVLRDTAIGRDLRSPPPVDPLHELFRTSCPDIAVSLAGPDEAWLRADARAYICIPNAESNRDLHALASSVLDSQQDILFSCASGLSETLAELLYGPERPSGPEPMIAGKALFVVGSLAPQAEAQVDMLIKNNSRARVFELRDTLSDSLKEINKLAETGYNFSVLVIRPKKADGKNYGDSQTIVEDLAECVVLLLKRIRISLLLATGGDTASALLAALKTGDMTIAGEVQPGVIHSQLETDQGSLRLVTKAGGFGEKNILCTVLEYFNCKI